MDPNATLRGIRTLVDDINRLTPKQLDGDHVARLLVERVAALDAWLTNGGFLPADWRSDARKAWRDGKELGYQQGFADGHVAGYASGEAAGINSVATQ